MPGMLGNSHALDWKLCDCRHCRHDHPRGGRPMKWYGKRAARRREAALWRQEATRDVSFS